MVAVDEVPMWWVLDGVGHVLYSECTCGECPDRYQSLCGIRGIAGETVESAPGRICSVCRERLACPGLRIDPDGVPRPTAGPPGCA